MHRYIVAAALLVAAALPAASAAHIASGQGTPQQQLETRIAHDRGVVAAVDRQARESGSAMYIEWSQWLTRQWHARDLVRAREALDRLLYGSVRDWHGAVVFVQRWFPGTSGWLLACSSSEGGHGGFVMNHKGSGAGGWMQYMSGTFTSDYRSAVAYLAARGVRVPSFTASWYSPLGQAIAAGWARYTGHTPPGKWTGALC